MKVPVDVRHSDLPEIFRAMVQIVPLDFWKRRGAELGRREQENGFLGPYFEDKYPIERAMERALSYKTNTGRYPRVRGSTGPLTYQLYSFLSTARSIHKALSPTGRRNLEGRIVDGLKGPHGLLPVALELSTAVHFSNGGFKVDFVDLEGTGQFDLLARKDELELEIDCKAVSGDLGRPIHRLRALELFRRLSPSVGDALKGAGGVIYRVVLSGSLTGQLEAMKEVAEIVVSAIEKRTDASIDGLVRVTVHQFDLDGTPFSEPDNPDPAKVSEVVSSALGISGGHVMSLHHPAYSAVIVYLESESKPDVPRAIYRQLKKSAKRQFSRERPAPLITRLTDLTMDQLASLVAEKTNGIAAIANRLCSNENCAHLAGVAFMAPADALTIKWGTASGTKVSQNLGRAIMYRRRGHPVENDSRLRTIFPPV